MGDTNYYDLPYPASTDKVSLGYQNMQDLAEQIDTILNDANLPIVGDGANVLRTDTVFASAVTGTYNSLVLDPTVALPNGMFATTQTQNDGSTKVATTSYVDTAALNFTLGIIPDNSLTNVKINSAAAIAYSKLNLATSIVNADIATSAAIAYSKLALTGAILNADLAGSIAYSKLSLANSIVNADISASAAIVDTKLATISTASKVSNSATTATDANTASAIVARDASGNFTAGTITAALTGNASTATSATSATTATTSTNIAGGLGGSIPYQTAVNTTALLANGTAGQVVTSAGTTLAPTWTTATNANTASAIVQRDASGNFTAGTITATNAVLTGYLQRTAPVTTAVNLTVAATTTWIICTAVAVLTLGTATAGREIMIKNTTAATVTSASSNVVPLLGGAASTAILAATAGKWTKLVGDGTNWIIMMSN